jgi:GTPase SAR1 family protein
VFRNYLTVMAVCLYFAEISHLCLYVSGALLVYDVSSRESFNSLANWLTDARTLASPAILILLVGNKKDLEDEREVTFLEASRCVLKGL